MFLHTKFHANRTIFGEVITFHKFSRWLPFAILNFEKFKFWIHFRGWSRNLRRPTKFGQNRMIGGRNIAIKRKSNLGFRFWAIISASINIFAPNFVLRWKIGSPRGSSSQKSDFRKSKMAVTILNFKKVQSWSEICGFGSAIPGVRHSGGPPMRSHSCRTFALRERRKHYNLH